MDYPVAVVRRGRMGPAIGIALALLALATVLFAFALPAYRDGCVATGVMVREGSEIKSDNSVWPAGVRCVTTSPGGAQVETFEGPGPWLEWTQLALVLGAAAFLIAGVVAGIGDTRRPAL